MALQTPAEKSTGTGGPRVRVQELLQQPTLASELRLSNARVGLLGQRGRQGRDGINPMIRFRIAAASRGRANEPMRGTCRSTDTMKAAYNRFWPEKFNEEGGK